MRWGRVGYKGQNSWTTSGSDLDAAKSVFTKKFQVNISGVYIYIFGRRNPGINRGFFRHLDSKILFKFCSFLKTTSLHDRCTKRIYFNPVLSIG